MPDYSRHNIPRMRDMPLAEQEALIARWESRHQLRSLYPEIVATMLQWIIDTNEANISIFVASGHEGLFSQLPSDDLAYRLAINGYTAHEINEAISRDEAPVNWMTQYEHTAVMETIRAMIGYCSSQPSGTFIEVCAIYTVIGMQVRRNFYQQYGYYPEQLPVPDVRITGEDREKKKLRLDNHQPPLLGDT